MSAETLRKAAQIVRERGWVQGAHQTPEGCCVAGAIDIAADNDWRDGRHSLAAFLGVRSIVDWNDAPERTADEVIAALESAAARLEATS